MTFQNLYEIYMEDMAARLKQSTLLTKKAVLQTHILPFFGSKPINEIKASDVRRWQAKLMSSPNNYSQTYLKKINTELNSIINYAKRFYDLNTNPCGKAGTIGKAKAEEMDYWTYDEYIAFREGVKDKSLSYICFEVLYWTGMREGELLALSPADIDLDNKTISINRTYQRIEGKDVFTSPKTRKSSERFRFRIFSARSYQTISSQGICLTQMKAVPGNKIISLTRDDKRLQKHRCKEDTNPRYQAFARQLTY